DWLWPWLDVAGITGFVLSSGVFRELIAQKLEISTKARRQFSEPSLLLGDWQSDQLLERLRLLALLALSLLSGRLVGLLLRTLLLALFAFLVLACCGPLLLDPLLASLFFGFLFACLLLFGFDGRLDHRLQLRGINIVLRGSVVEPKHPLGRRLRRQPL